MLHVFNVNQGKTLAFEVNLAMGRVLELKNVIAEMHSIASEKQVMLISDGKALCDEERVCSYAGGTETNPVYLFDKACIEKEMLQLEVTHQEGIDFVESIKNAQTLAPSFKTVVARTNLALRLHDATRQRVQLMKNLVHDEHLMYQGWRAAVLNLSETAAGSQKRAEAICAQCQTLFEKVKKSESVLDGMDAVLQSLEQIPVLPTLLKSGKSGSLPSNPENFQVNLLHWIRAQCKDVSVQSVLNECRQKQKYLSQERYSSLLDECRKAGAKGFNTNMSEISGIGERLVALDKLVFAAEQQVKEQTGIAQGFVRNRETAQELHDNVSSIDALFTLCESHVTQLHIMSENETMTRNALRKCTHAKEELATNLHTRLRWLYSMQRGMLNADVKLSMFAQQLTLLQRQIEFLGQVKQCPALYLSSLVEVVRRKHFADTYIQWANKAVTEARVERDREIVKRKAFKSSITGHFLQKLFHGLSDKPPSLSKKPLRTFDDNLPDVTPEQLMSLSHSLPNYRDILEVPISISGSITSSATLAHSSAFSTMVASANLQCARPDSRPEVRSLGTSTEDSPTGSFAMVDPAAVTQPGGFVVTSMENVKRANLEGERTGDIVLKDDINPLRRAPSSTTLTEDQQISPPSSPLQRTGSDAVFARTGDVGSLPDSEFYSVIPGSFESGRQPSMDTQLSAPGSSSFSPPDFLENFDSPVGAGMNSPALALKLSAVKVGSLGSNSSTSYQKVDELSSDEEMFHSFTNDQQDVKILKKQLQRLQTDYNNLLDKGKIEKEELKNDLIRKHLHEISILKESQVVMESDFEKRWGESKSELDNVIKQLESERLERKKAWMEGATLEKKLKVTEEELHGYQLQIENLQTELTIKGEAILNLENDVSDCKTKATAIIGEADRKFDELAQEKESADLMHQSALLKLEKEISLAHAELSAAEDRIQDLETVLSNQERKQQEGAVQLQEFEARVHELSRELSVACEFRQKSLDETVEARQTIAEEERRIKKANEQISALQNLLADYEIKLEDDRNKDVVLKNLRASLARAEIDKTELETIVKSSEDEIKKLHCDLTNLQDEIQSVRSMAVQDAKSHLEEVDKIRSEHRAELESSSVEHKKEVRILSERHEGEMQKVIQDNTTVLCEKVEEWCLKEEEIRASYRAELDELEADRLESVASAQQSIEDLREKVRESSRVLEQERKDSVAVKSSMMESSQRMEGEYARILQENETMSSVRTELEDRLFKAEEDLRILQEKEKQDVAVMNPLLESTMTSSTDEVVKSKRSKIDFSSSYNTADSARSFAVFGGRESVPVEEHEREIGIMRNNFEEDKKALKDVFKKREEDAAKRRQMIFNSAIQRVTASKDTEIKNLKQQLMAQSLIGEAGHTQLVTVTPPQPMTMSLTQPSASLPSPPSFSTILSQPTARSSSPLGSVSSRSPSDSAKDKDRIAVNNFHVGDIVLVCFKEVYQQFTLLSTSRTLYFVHHESLERLGISTTDPESKKAMIFATLTEKEYCQARKVQNRFLVPINTKFFRVKVAALSRRGAQT